MNTTPTLNSANCTWQAVIGLEIHVQLATRSKLFSASSTAYGAEPNTQTCGLDAGLPGTLPVPNREAIRMAILFGLSVNATITPYSIFARKNYFYPDLPKGYQISQYELPIVSNGVLSVRVDAQRSLDVAIERAHLEEDAGKSLHDVFHAATGIDLNRAGVPLLEIVSTPMLHSAQEAVAYMRGIHTLVRWLGICDGNMQEGSFRCDANVSVRRMGDTKLGTRTEIKNVNSFRFVEKAIDYEIERQIRAIENGERIIQETRLYDAAKDQTRSMRSKESADDYRYFPDPDLPPLLITDTDIKSARAHLPELPEARRQRYIETLKLPEQDATALCADKPTADYFEALLNKLSGDAKLCANWVLGEVSAALNDAGLTIAQSPITAISLATLLQRIREGIISGKIAKEVFSAMWADGSDADRIIEQRGLKQISDAGALTSAINEVIAEFSDQVAEYRNGQDKLFTFFVGQVMKKTRGQANPQQLSELLRKKLNAVDLS